MSCRFKRVSVGLAVVGILLSSTCTVAYFDLLTDYRGLVAEMAEKKRLDEQRLIVAGLLLQMIDPDPSRNDELVSQIRSMRAKYPHPRKDVLLVRLQQAVVLHRRSATSESLARVVEAATAALQGEN